MSKVYSRENLEEFILEYARRKNAGESLDMECFEKGVAKGSFVKSVENLIHFMFACNISYRFKPKTHIVNEIEVPAPDVNGKWFINKFGEPTRNDECSDIDIKYLIKIGNVFSTEEDAQANSDAMWKKHERKSE